MQQQVSQGFQLSPQQKHRWFLQQPPGALPEWAWGQVLIEGPLDKAALKEALRAVVRRHEVLRTTFRQLSGMQVPLQVIIGEGGEGGEGMEWEDEEDWRHLGEPERRRRLAALMEAESPATVAAATTPLRLSLFRLADSEHCLLVRLSALCADEATLENLVLELRDAYASVVLGEPTGDEPMQYVVASEWFNSLLESESGAAGKRFWRLQDYGKIHALRLPNEKPLAHEARFQVARFASVLAPELSARLTQLAETHATTLPVLLLAGWQILLSRLTGHKSVLVGTAFDGRTDEELQRALGLFTKYLPIHTQVESGVRLGELLPNLNEAMLAASEWQECFSWDEVVRAGSDLGDARYFPYCFQFQNAPPRWLAQATAFSLAEQVVYTDRFHLRLAATTDEDSLRIAFHYDASLYEASDIERLSEEFRTLLRSLTADPEAAVDTLEILGGNERGQLIDDFNDTSVNYGQAVCLHELVARQASQTPQQVAVEFEDRQLSYGELNARANRLAHYLRRQGVGPDAVVGISVERSLEMVIGVLGILKSGGAYLPLSPSLPTERLTFALGDAGAQVLLTEERWGELLPTDGVKVIYLDEDWEKIAAESPSEPVSEVTADNLAYVMYTSGSTGKPKGVMISHRAINNRLLWMQKTYPLSASDKLLQKTVFHFDASVWELFLPLLAGAQVVLARADGHQDSAYLVQTIIERGVTVLQVVPSMLRVLLDEPRFADCRSLRDVFCGGEALPIALQEKFYATLDADLHNLYGPTEVAIDATYWDCQRGADYGTSRGLVPIGKPLNNVTVYLLDARLRAVPFGVTGEVYVGGSGLARGYLNRPDLTAEKFLPNPFSKEPGARLYRTGDLGRFLPSQAIEFLGRTDHQVKVRGFRIELGEIEAVLSRHPAVRQAVAAVREDEPGKQQLVAYVVPRSKRRDADAETAFQYYRLPNEMDVAHLNRSETDWLYQEIFIDDEYGRHGITLADGDCVFDIGANIGLFTLYIHTQCRNATVYAFEPSPPTCAVLRENVESYGLDVKVYQCAISDKARTAEFTFYPKVSASSGLYANVQEDADVTRAFIGNQGELGEYADELLEGRFEAVTYTCQLRTVSEIIAENAVTQIDLLKVDVEKSELDVLRGIAPQDWGKIRQIVLEVHDQQGRLQGICELLQAHGFEISLDQHPSLQHTGLYNLYAVHPSRRDSRRGRQGDISLLPKNGKLTLTTGELRLYLREKLPDYMVPAAFVMLDEMPLNANGKVDRKALPAPSEPRREPPQQAAPQTPVQELIAGIWGKVLGVEPVGIRENFFELGGHSLLATQVVSRLREAFRKEIPLRTIFEAPTVEGLARSLEKLFGQESGLAAPPLRPYAPERQAPLSFAQQRLWFLDQLEPGNFFFNVPAAIRLSGRFDPQLLERTLNEIVKRHEVLRTTFPEVAGEPVQCIAEQLPIEVPVLDLSHLEAGERESGVRRLATAEAQRPFNLSTGPLLRAQVVRLADEEHVVFFTMHHIISDGWSMDVLVNEVMAIYRALQTGETSALAALPIQYADYARWQRDWLRGEVLEKHLAYWRRQLGEKPEILALPTDFPRPPVQTYKGATRPVRVAKDLTDALKSLTGREGATLFMTLLAAFAVLLHRHSGQEKFVVGTDVANRNRTEIERLIGFFVNQLALRVDLSGNPSFRRLLARVRELTLAAYAHQELPFDKLVEALRPERDVSRAPLFQVKLVLQNAPLRTLELPGLALSPVEFEGGKANLDLTMFLGESEHGLSGVMEYNTDLFASATIERLLANFERLLARIVADPDISVRQLKDALDAAESAQAEAQKKKVAATSLEKFKRLTPKTVQMPRGELVKFGSLDGVQQLPLVIEPALENLDLSDWARSHRAQLEAQLLKHGALLFRNFKLDPQLDFARFTQAVCDNLFIENGEHPRQSLGGHVYTPVFYPAEQMLLWHNENSFNHRWPGRIWFACVQPARQGGETPVVDSRKVFAALDRRIKDRFMEKGVMYVRNYGDGLGLGWQTVFQTDDRQAVEQQCRQARMEIIWKDGERARTRCVRPAVVRHPQTGELCWFNQAQHWHLSCLDAVTRESIEATFDESDYPRSCYYGDGSVIEASVMEEILQVYKASEVVFAWQAGDILMLDNMLTAHGRNPFLGERKLLVAMGEMRSFAEVESC